MIDNKINLFDPKQNYFDKCSQSDQYDDKTPNAAKLKDECVDFYHLAFN